MSDLRHTAYDRTAHIPKILQCMHTFCLLCLESMHGSIVHSQAGTNLICPVCKRPHPLPSDGNVRSIPSNFGYVDLLEMVTTRASASGLMKENKNRFVRPSGGAANGAPMEAANADASITDGTDPMAVMASNGRQAAAFPPPAPLFLHGLAAQAAAGPQTARTSFSGASTSSNGAATEEAADASSTPAAAPAMSGDLHNGPPSSTLAGASVTLCDECDDEERTAALHFCLTCARPLCEFHRTNHIKSKITKTHPLVALSSIGPDILGRMTVPGEHFAKPWDAADADVVAAASMPIVHCHEHAAEESSLFCQVWHQFVLLCPRRS